MECLFKEFHKTSLSVAERPPKPGSENLETPPTKLSALAFASEKETPPCLPKPMAKRQLLAAKRLEKELKGAKMTQGGTAKENGQEGAGEKKLKKDTVAKGKTKKLKRKPNDGPMECAMKEYIRDCRSRDGCSYAEARSMWGESKERRAIIEGMTEAERRRRRFQLA